MLWGPYLWANGPISRMDGLAWFLNDFQVRGGKTNVHPVEWDPITNTTRGAAKSGRLMLDFFLGDQLARPWFNP